MADALRGGDFRALVRLSDRANVTLALPGETCDHVPATSLPWLLSSGRIVPLSAPHAPTDAERADLGRPVDADEFALEDVGLEERFTRPSTPIIDAETACDDDEGTR